MNNSKSTKRALLMSVISLFLCFAMLIGTTYAWFTDSAVSANNKITAGTLDVELYKWTSATEKTNISNSKAPVFDANIQWEPGYTEVVYLSIKNEGSLALKFKVALNVTSVTGANLADVLEYTVTDGATFGSVTSWAGNGTKLINTPGINDVEYQDVVLDPNEEFFFAVSVHMLESAGNEYQNASITFDIQVQASQANVEADAFGPNYDLDALYNDRLVTTVPAFADGEAGKTVEIKNTDDYKVASFMIPASAAKDDTTLSITVEKVPFENASFTVAANEKVAAFDVKVDGIKDEAEINDPIKVQLRIPAGLDPATVKLYHYNTLIDSSYNPNTGYVTFETKSFSPFTVVYDAESEYEAPDVTGMDRPTATVTYEAEYVGADKITWGDFGQWSPTAGLDSDLEAAFTFACPTDLDPEVEAAFENWYCDFYVSLDKALGANQIFLGGNYGSFGWVGFHNGDLTLVANEEIGLLKGVTTNPWTYADVRDFVGEFTCGVGDVNNALEGATFTVKLRLTNPANAAEYYDVNVVTYTFGGTYTIQ